MTERLYDIMRRTLKPLEPVVTIDEVRLTDAQVQFLRSCVAVAVAREPNIGLKRGWWICRRGFSKARQRRAGALACSDGTAMGRLSAANVVDLAHRLERPRRASLPSRPRMPPRLAALEIEMAEMRAREAARTPIGSVRRTPPSKRATRPRRSIA